MNIGRNLVPDSGPTGASWWLLWLLSFGIEAMISVPILEVLSQAATAARLGVTVERRKILLFQTPFGGEYLASLSVSGRPGQPQIGFRFAISGDCAATQLTWSAARDRGLHRLSVFAADSAAVQGAEPDGSVE
ncbi:hypothetical protein [Nocardia asiatica]|uniref:hypothetical protein n=1 Tax=Nocardia asiatica TaxID=209252 RepID=UPI002458B419|nr:hypothetical protein [Nocardia asiatica]